MENVHFNILRERERENSAPLGWLSCSGCLENSNTIHSYT